MRNCWCLENFLVNSGFAKFFLELFGSRRSIRHPARDVGVEKSRMTWAVPPQPSHRPISPSEQNPRIKSAAQSVIEEMQL
jgi:hypothetical protein